MDGNDGIVWYLRASEQDFGVVRKLVIEGRVSNATAPELHRVLGNPNHRAVVVDLSGVDYVNGAGLKVFESVARAAGASGGQLIVCGLQPVVQTAFDLAGPLPHLTIEPSSDAAVRRLLG